MSEWEEVGGEKGDERGSQSFGFLKKKKNESKKTVELGHDWQLFPDSDFSGFLPRYLTPDFLLFKVN